MMTPAALVATCTGTTAVRVMRRSVDQSPGVNTQTHLSPNVCTAVAPYSGSYSSCYCLVRPLEKLTVSFSRSSGPGGQNVNKCEFVHQCHALGVGWGEGGKGERGAWPYAMVMYVSFLLVVSTKAEVRFHVNSADWIPDRVKHRVLNMVQ